MRREGPATVILATVVLISPVCCHSQDVGDRLDSFFTTLSKQHHLNGCVLVADHGKVLYKNAFGYSDFDARRSLTTDSMFELASIAKQFTAMGIMILNEKGLLDYSSHIQTFFPELPYGGVTIRHLLNHTSGLVDYGDLVDAHWDASRIATNRDILDLLREQQPALLSPPGDKYHYSNTGYVLLALIIEKISRLTYGQFLKREIWVPCGMTRTMVYRRRFKPEAVEDYALGYVLSFEHNGYALPDSVDRHKRVITLDGLQGDGGISSTVEDLFRWDRCLYTDRLVSQETLQEAFTGGRLNDGSEIDIGFRGDSYGFGWRIHKSDDGKIVWHTGHYPGYSNLITRYTDIDRTIIGLSNNGYEFYRIMETVNSIVNGESATLPLRYFAEELRRMLLDNDAASVADSIKTMVVNKDRYVVEERRINDLGYELLNLGRLNDATAVLFCNTQLFPTSANVFDSLGEAYMRNGDRESAILNYERALRLEPGMRSAVSALEKLKMEVDR